MMIIDKLKKFFSGFFGKEEKAPEQKNNDVAIEKCDSLSDETPEVANPNVHISDSSDLLINLIDDDLVEEPMPCVYGPPSWYNENGGLDRKNPEVKEFINETEEIEKRNRLRRELRNRLQESIDEPMAAVYGPDPTAINKWIYRIL